MSFIDNLTHLRSRADVLATQNTLASTEFVVGALECAAAITKDEPAVAVIAGICSIVGLAMAHTTAGDYKLHEKLDRMLGTTTLNESVPTFFLGDLPIDFDEDVLPAERKVMNE